MSEAKMNVKPVDFDLLAHRVQALMEENELTQSGLAELSGVNAVIIHEIVHAKIRPGRLDLYSRIAQALGTTPSYLFGLVDYPELPGEPVKIRHETKEATMIAEMVDELPLPERQQILSLVEFTSKRIASTNAALNRILDKLYSIIEASGDADQVAQARAILGERVEIPEDLSNGADPLNILAVNDFSNNAQ